MDYHHDFFDLKPMNDTDEIIRKTVYVVPKPGIRGATVATAVEGDATKSGAHERRHLVLPSEGV
jgi:hypothetical protein